jgi:hypothetical protein
MWTMHAAPDHQAAKMYAMQALGAFDFDFVRTTMGKEPYPACYDSGNPMVRSTSPDKSSCEGLKLLAWHPDVALQDTGSPYELALVMRGMAQLAALMGRTLVWPDLPCNATRYISKRPLVKPGEQLTYNKTSPPLDIWSLWYPHGDFRCSWTLPTAENCMNKQRSMQVWEAANWMKRLPSGTAVTPTPGVNIISATKGAVAAAQGSSQAPARQEEQQQEEEAEEEQQQQDSAGAAAASDEGSNHSSRGRLVVANITLSFQVAGDNATVAELLMGMDDLLATRQRRHRRSGKRRSSSRSSSSSSSSSSSEERPAPSRRLASFTGLNQGLGAWPRRLLRRHLSGDPVPFEATLSPFIKTTIEVTAEQVQSFVQQHPELMRQPVLYLATPVRVKEFQGDGTPAKDEVAKVKGIYRDFVLLCDALGDKKLMEKIKFEYGDSVVPSVEALMTEGSALVVAPGVVMAQ